MFERFEIDTSFPKMGLQVLGGHGNLVNVSQEMIGVRWPWEEWKPKVAELVNEVSVVLDKRKCSSQDRFFL